jgi:uncharacterized protein
MMTVGVYGLVAGIVKLDDAGAYLIGREGILSRKSGKAILAIAPWLMKALSVAGTAAMFLVGGGIVAHGVPQLHPLVERMTASGASPVLVGLLVDASTGILLGAFGVGVVLLCRKLWPERKTQ